MTSDARFARLVSLACHDLRTPLATVHGFARTLRRVELVDPAPHYAEMIEVASQQLAELIDELSLISRIEAGRFEPRLESVDSLELAKAAAAELEAGTVEVVGEGSEVEVEIETTQRAIRQLARAARRHGGLETIELRVQGAELEIRPIAGTAGVVVTGEELRELGAAVAGDALRALGATLTLEDDVFRIVLPAG